MSLRRFSYAISSIARPCGRTPYRGGRAYKEKPQQGEVIAVGPGARDEKGVIQSLDVKAGDRVLFGKWSGSEVKIDGEELLIMKESDIMGVLEGTATSKKKAA